MVTSISKEEIALLPIATFTGRIIVIQTENEVEKAISFLEQHTVVGFDSETRPAFQKGRVNKIALIQLSTKDTCFLFRLNLIGFPDRLINFLSNPKIRKIGLSLKDDFSAIRKTSSFVPHNFIELQAFVKKYRIEEMSLQKIYAILFGCKISKGQRLTNWEATILTPAQQMYAALDAWACLEIYTKLTEEKI